MDKEEFLSLYRRVLNYGWQATDFGVVLLRTYIEEQGTEKHNQYKEEFIAIIAAIPPLYKHCLAHVIDYYVNKFSVVKLIKNDPNAQGETIILVY